MKILRLNQPLDLKIASAMIGNPRPQLVIFHCEGQPSPLLMFFEYQAGCDLIVRRHFSDAKQKTKEHVKTFENPTMIRLESEVLKDPKKRFLVASKSTKR